MHLRRAATAGAILVALLALGCGAGGSEAAVAERASASDLARGRVLNEMFHAGRFEALHDMFSAEFKVEMPVDKMQIAHQQTVGSYGPETELVVEEVLERNGYTLYRRQARYERAPGVIESRWAWRGDDDLVAGFRIRPVTR